MSNEGEYEKIDTDDGVGGMIVGFCTPLKIYLYVAVIATIIFLITSIFKGKGFPSLSTWLCTSCCIMLVASFLTGCCASLNFVLAWVTVIILSLCSIIGTLLYIVKG